MTELPSAPGVKIIRRENAAAWHDGYAFLKAARDEAANITAEAHRVFEDARAKAIEGAKLDVATELAEQRLEAARDLEASLAGLEVEIIDLVMSITWQVIGTYPDLELVVLMAKKVMSDFRHEKLKKIRVAPEAAALVQAAIQPDDEVETDISLGRGQLVCTGTHTVLDAGIDTQLSAIREGMIRSGGLK